MKMILKYYEHKWFIKRSDESFVAKSTNNAGMTYRIRVYCQHNVKNFCVVKVYLHISKKRREKIIEYF